MSTLAAGGGTMTHYAPVSRVYRLEERMARLENYIKELDYIKELERIKIKEIADRVDKQWQEARAGYPGFD